MVSFLMECRKSHLTRELQRTFRVPRIFDLWYAGYQSTTVPRMFVTPLCYTSRTDDCYLASQPGLDSFSNDAMPCFQETNTLSGTSGGSEMLSSSLFIETAHGLLNYSNESLIWHSPITSKTEDIPIPMVCTRNT